MLGWKKTFGNRHNFLKKNNPKKHNIEGLELAIKLFERCGYRHNCNFGGLDININQSGGQRTFREGLELDIDYVYFHPFHMTNMFMSNLPKITNMFISTYLISPCLVPLWLRIHISGITKCVTNFWHCLNEEILTVSKTLWHLFWHQKYGSLHISITELKIVWCA